MKIRRNKKSFFFEFRQVLIGRRYFNIGPDDLGSRGVKKMISMNVKKILLFECGINSDSKHTYLPHEFRIFRE
ncbi:hypothetical protein SAMN02787073_2034 [Chryseobacterium vrystaatense]|uniref:Uncharacterized protein n=1 Tax=Chryseobacterium vrystaatense TaxID=307480 RepID=A0A1M5AUR0_9FLAO|nr:hypothetical protein SAMN02787073_2034 [Chryseobacterium vrystaatense]